MAGQLVEQQELPHSALESNADISMDTEPFVDELLLLSNELFIQMMDYEKVTAHIFNLVKWLRKHKSRPINLTIPGDNFRISVGDGMLDMYSTFRQLKWDQIKDTVHQMKTYARHNRGFDLQLDISTRHGDLPATAEFDWASMYWMYVDKEHTRSS